MLLAVGIAVATLRCSGDGGPTEPRVRTPGEFTLVVHSPNGAEGAALLDIDAAAVTGVTADPETVFTAADGPRLRILIARAVPGALTAKVAVSDTTARLDPRLLQVAGPTSALRPSLAAYVIEVRR